MSRLLERCIFRYEGTRERNEMLSRHRRRSFADEAYRWLTAKRPVMRVKSSLRQSGETVWKSANSYP
jgi:hypothetical protein